MIDGAAGVALVARGRLLGALGFTYHQDKIAHIEVISHPDHPHHVDLATLDN